MQTDYAFEEFDLGSTLVHDLIQQRHKVKELVSDFYDADRVADAIASKKITAQQRSLLVEVLVDQNKVMPLSEITKANISRLAEEQTFTVTTGHQLNLLGGPLFSIYKIAQVIAICKDLGAKYPAHHFVPVFWMATEDHDFEEINHVHLFGKTISWNKEGQQDVIAGRLKTESLQPVLAEVETLFQDAQLKAKLEELTAFYRQSGRMADATRRLINHLFSEHGLVILDGDDRRLKKTFVPVFLREIRDAVVCDAVGRTNAVLEKSGYHQQVYVRDCNLFYIHPDGRRERIIKEDGSFRFNDRTYTPAETEALVESDAAAFSPNALLRPVYQETILPNLIYVGGAGEIAYWLQLKQVFDRLGVEFPLLRVRDSAILLREKELAELEELQLSLPDLKNDVHQLIHQRILERVGDQVNLADSEADLFRAKSKVLEKTGTIDKSLVALVEAEFSKMITALEKIEARLVRSEKEKEERTMKRIERLQGKIFPAGGFQERYDNFLPYYLSSPEFINKLVSTFTAEAVPRIRLIIDKA